MVESQVQVLFNPRCSKCRQTQDLLKARGESFELIPYLDGGLDREALLAWLGALGSEDPRVMLRTKEALYQELGLASADRDELLAAMVAHPSLIERPIVRKGDRAIVARPPELANEVL